MENELESLKTAILVEYEQNGEVDTRRWLSAHPHQAVALLDFIIFLDSAPRVSEHASEEWRDDEGIAVQAMQAACANIPTSAQKTDIDYRTLGAQLAKLRSTAPSTGGKAPATFRRAAVLAWVVDSLEKYRPRVTRLATQKTVYFLERSMNLSLFLRFQEQKLGPYDSQIRYFDAEPIAKNKGWILSDGTEFRRGGKVSEVATYATRYVRSTDLASRLLQLLAALSDADLETLATIDVVAQCLMKERRPITYGEIRKELAAHEVWRDKLSRSNFSEERVADAVHRLRELLLIAPP